MPTYNKLVRDKIVEIIQAKGEKVFFHIASESEYRDELIRKVVEEAKEFEATPTIEEGADIIEALYALFGQEVLEQARQKKAEKRGGFEKRIILERTAL